MDRPQYINWFIQEHFVCLEDGFPVECYRLNYSIDEEVLDNWALHIRRHYESDEELEEALQYTGMSKEEYLREYVIPQPKETLGPTSRANDITEIMISDLLEFIHNFTVPRCKQYNRSGKNSSKQGSDILAYKFFDKNQLPSPKDELLAVEVKAKLTSDSYDSIRNAANDSLKDNLRYSFTLNYYRRELKMMNKIKESECIARFQKKSENNFILKRSAAAIISRKDIDNVIIGINGDEFELKVGNDMVFLVHGEKLMELTHEVYRRCIK